VNIAVVLALVIFLPILLAVGMANLIEPLDGGE